MPWVQKTVHAGRCIYIQRHYSSRYGSKHKCTRGSNYGKTSEAQAIVNNRQACLQQEMIFNANFGPGDLTATFTFRKADRPKNLQEIKKLWAAYMVKLRYAYKKAGVEFKWMRAIETPDKNPHIHMALSGIDIAKLPRWPYGRVDFVPVDDRDHHTYGGYLREETHIKQGHKGKYNTAKAKVCYGRSRNLTVPEPEYKIIYNDHWADEPKAPKGYYVVRDTLNNWEDEVTGFKYQSYVLCPISKNQPHRRC